MFIERSTDRRFDRIAPDHGWFCGGSKGWKRFVTPLFRIVIRKRAGAGLAGECGAEWRACAGKGSALKCCWSGGNAKGGGDGVRHECADGFDNSLAGAGGGVILKDE